MPQLDVHGVPPLRGRHLRSMAKMYDGQPRRSEFGHVLPAWQHHAHKCLDSVDRGMQQTLFGLDPAISQIIAN